MPRTVKRIDRSRKHDFDEQLWPVNIALLVLCGFLGGLITAYSEFEPDRVVWYHNGWLRLATLFATVGAFIGMSFWLGGQRGRRFQLAAVLSLLIHALLGWQLYNTVFTNDSDKRGREPVVAKRELIEYQYHPDALKDEKKPQDFEKPVETKIETTKVEQVERAQAVPKPVEIKQPLPEPEREQPKPTETPQTVAPKVEQATPRRDETPSKMARVENAQAQPVVDVRNPTRETPKATAPTERLMAQADTRARSEQQPNVAAQAQAAPTRTETQPTQLAAATPRAAPSPTTPATTAAKELPRTTPNSPTAAASSATEPTPNAASATAKSEQLTAAPAAANKSAATPSVTAPTATPRTNESQAPSPTAVAMAVRPTTQPDASAQARNDTPTPTRDARAATAAAGAIATDVATPTAKPNGDPATQQLAAATAGSTARAQTAAPTVATNLAPNAGASATVANATPTTPGAARMATPTESATASNAASPAGLSARPAAMSAAQAIAESIKLPSIDSPNAGAPSDALGGPASTTVTTRNSGTPGQTQSVNLESNWADSAASNRPTGSAAQAVAATTAPGQATSATRASPTRDAGTAGGDVAASTQAALDVPDALERGGAAPAGLNASAAPNPNRADSRAAVGPIAAAAGDASFDVGTPATTGAKPAASTGSAGSAARAELAGSRDAPQRSELGGGTQLAKADAAAQDVAMPSLSGGSNTTGGANSGLTAGTPATERGATGALVGGIPAAGATGLSSAGTPSPGMVAAAAPRGGNEAGSASGSGIANPLGRGLTNSPGAGLAGAEDVAVPGGGTPGTPGNTNGAPQLTALGGASGGNGGRPGGGPRGPDVTGPAFDGALAMSNGGAGSGATGAFAGGPASTAIVRATGDGNATAGSAATGSIARTTGGATGGGTADLDLPDVPGLPRGPSGAPSIGATLQPGGLTGTTGRAKSDFVAVLGPIGETAGLGDHFTPRVGVLLPQARKDGTVVTNDAARFLNRTAGGATAVDGQVREPSPAFRKRGRVSNLEAEIELGLEFISKAQDADGSWSFQLFPGATKDDVGTIKSDTAATALALLSFLGAGYDHYGDDYQANVEGGLAFLVKNQKPNGDLYLTQDAYSNQSAWLYSHAMATIALCEAYGMTGDDKLREPAQKALDFIVRAQSKAEGGWRYVPGQGSDTSVTGWQVMALKSGELAKLKVDKTAYDGVRKWLDGAQARATDGAIDPGIYVYNPNAPDTVQQRGGRIPTAATTSMGLLIRMYLGSDRENAGLQRGAEFLLDNLPEFGTATEKKRDTYYWYYASQVMFHMQGDAWKQWNDQLRPLLLNSQVKTGMSAGSWDPNGRIPDKWGRFGGRLYVTTMNLLSLEVAHRYLPIYERIAEK